MFENKKYILYNMIYVKYNYEFKYDLIKKKYLLLIIRYYLLYK